MPPEGSFGTAWQWSRVSGGMRKFLFLVPVVFAFLSPAPVAATSGGRPVALVTAETANEVVAVSLGKYGGHVLRRVHLVDPLMIASASHGPAVVVSPGGTVTLLAWHSLRPIKIFRDFGSPEVAAVTPNGKLAYVTDERTGELTVIDLRGQRIVGRVFVGLRAHHLGISPDGRRIWVALGESATTIVRLNASNPRRPRVIGRFRPRFGAHDVAFAPGGGTVLVTSPSSSTVSAYTASGRHPRLLWTAGAGRGPEHVVFSGDDALVSSGYSSSLEALSWRHPSVGAYARATVPYGSFNLATYGGYVVTTSLLTGQVSELLVRDLHLLWTAKVAPAARYVAISVWPR
jgi:DNA-binding beta-propeller fold protein YncE